MSDAKILLCLGLLVIFVPTLIVLLIGYIFDFLDYSEKGIFHSILKNSRKQKEAK